MPKATWGSGDQALTAADIDNVDTSNNFKPYTGSIPGSGVYRFVLRRIKKGISSTNNPKALIILALDGTWRKEHAAFEACPLFDHMPVMKSTAFRVRAFCDAMGISSSDFMNRMIVDDDGRVTKIGKLELTGEELVYVNVVREKGNEEHGPRLTLNGTGYLAVDDDEVGDDAAEDEEAPVAAPF